MKKEWIEIRKSEDRGKTQNEWLNARHTFSFGDYIDSKFSSFGSLFVINDDRIKGKKGFGIYY
jgi:redox-sensitive bicupin YhaK (pirin superfamily)